MNTWKILEKFITIQMEMYKIIQIQPNKSNIYIKIRLLCI
jgi:hypothetical protein